ncbi:MAG: PEP-CTERM sorting domain-containing protein [Puniceicoccales bacterium]|jgi:hypothetical protein|nr:PEP-CTERM sorting domain-containing protein [Puniceicoccales bacterium]
MKATPLLLSACASLGLISATNAATITLINGDFSVGTDGLALDATRNAAQGWNSYASTGAQLPGSGGGVDYYFASTGAAGFQSAGGNYISQIFSTSDEGTVDASTFGLYTINLDLGYRNTHATAGNISMEISLWSGSQKLAFDNYTIIDPGVVDSTNPMTSTTINLSYDNSMVMAGSPIEIRITNTHTTSPTWDGTALVDNVSITATAIPEPSSYAFAGLAVLGVVTLVVRRRKMK